VGVVMGVALM